LTVESGRMACVEFEPISGTFVGYTPLPGATTWKLEVPCGISIEHDGKVDLFRVTVCPRENRLAIEHALRPGESTAGIAAVLRCRGMKNPKILLNGSDAVLGIDGSLSVGWQRSFPEPSRREANRGGSADICRYELSNNNCNARTPQSLERRAPFSTSPPADDSWLSWMPAVAGIRGLADTAVTTLAFAGKRVDCLLPHPVGWRRMVLLAMDEDEIPTTAHGETPQGLTTNPLV